MNPSRLRASGRALILILSTVATASALAQPEAGDAGHSDLRPDAADAGHSDPRHSGADELREIEAALAADSAASGHSADAGEPRPADGPWGAVGQTAGALYQSMNPDIALILDVAGAWFSEEEPLQTGGHDPVKNGFNLQQLELSIGRSVDPYFRFDANIVFAAEEVEIEEAYVTTLDLPAQLQLRAGQFLTRFGRTNATHPHSWAFADQPFMLGRYFGGESNRGLGLEGSWLTPLPWYVELVGSATDAAGEGTARSFYGANDRGVSSPLDLQYTAAVKQFFELGDDLSVLWGLSGAMGPNPNDQLQFPPSLGAGTETQIAGTDLYVKYRPLSGSSNLVLSLQAEAFYRRREVALGQALTDYGLYAQGLWRFSQRWAAAVRFEHGSPTTDSAGEVVADDLDPDWTGSRQRYSANLSFWPTEFSRLRLQGSADVPRWEGRVRYAAFLTLEVVVGAHGAHSF